jgi:tripartite ATP-independent transporter DctP family solute receptor
MRKIVKMTFLFLFAGFLGLNCSAANADQPVKFGLYAMQPPFIPISKSMEKLKAYLEKETDGKIAMDLFLGGQLGAESAGINKVKIGTVQTGNFSGVAISAIEPKANVLLMPFVFKTWEEVEKFATGPIMLEIGQSLEKKGLKLLGVANYGFRKILAVDRFVPSPEELNGLKVRVYPTPIMVDLYKALGAAPTPIAFPEIYTALQQGVINAADCSLDSSYASKQYEVAKYLTVTNHVHGWFLLVANSRWFNGLSNDMQKIISTGFEKYASDAREAARSYDDEILEKFKKEGVKVLELTDEQRAKYKEVTSEIHDKYKNEIGAEFMERFYKATNY